MSILRSSAPLPPARTVGELRETYQLLRTSLRGRHIVAVTESRYLDNERRLLSKMAERLQTSAEAVSYEQFLSASESLGADILMLRTSKLFVVSFPEVLDALEAFRRANPRAAVIASVLDARAFDVLTSRHDIVNLVDMGAATNDHELLRKGAEVLERLA